MRHNKAAVTIRDVARVAGVSVSTVSRVLNEKDDVAADTVARVQAVIQELAYTSSLAARSLRSRRTNVIGLIVPDIGDSFSIQVMKGVNRAIARADYDLIAYTSGSTAKPSSAEHEQYYVSLLNGSLTDGVVIVTPGTTSFSTAGPVVAVDPNKQGPGCTSVIATNHAGAVTAMEYLLGLGHRRIGFIGGRPDLQSAEQRLQGYKDALGAHGIAPDSVLITVGDFTTATARLCARRLLQAAERPTAIFAANDQSAIGAVEAAREMGLQVPQDLSVVGFDNIPEAAYFNPALTTVDQFIDRMGQAATEILIDLIKGRAIDSTRCEVATQLVVRDSCRPMGSAGAGRGTG